MQRAMVVSRLATLEIGTNQHMEISTPSQPRAAALPECYFLKSLIICFITMKIIPTVIMHRINANRAFIATKKVQTLKNSSHGHSKKLIATIS